MKKLLLFLVALVAFACNDDDNDTHPIVGTWNLSALYQDGIQIELTPCEFQERFVFNENNTMLYTSAFDFDDTCFTDDYSGTYEVSGNVLTVTADDDTGAFNILELNDSILRIQLADADADVMVFTRQ